MSKYPHHFNVHDLRGSLKVPVIQGSRVVSQQAAFHLQHFFIQTCWFDVQQEAEELKEPLEGLWQ